MTAILKVIPADDQILDQGTPTMKGRALIAWGNGGLFGEIGVVANNPAGIFSDGGENQSFGFHAENAETFSAIGLTHNSIFDASSSAGDQGFFYGTYDSIAAAIFEKEHVVDFGCGVVEIDTSPFEEPDIANGIIILSSGSMQTMVGAISGSASAGNVAVTGLGFQPDLIFFGRFGHSFFGDPGVHLLDVGLISIGAADGHGNQWAFGCEAIPYQAPGSAHRFRSSNCSASKVAIRQDPFPYVSHVSMDPDGFTLNWSAADTDIIEYWAISDPAGEFKVGMGFDGDASFTPGFRADAVVFATSGTTVLDLNQAYMMIGMGGSDNQLNQMSGWAGASLLDNNHQAHYWNTSAISLTHAFDRGAPLTGGVTEAHTTAFNATTVDLSWTNVVGTRYFGWAAMKTGLGPGFDGCGGFTPGLLRWTKR
jgi:hypothetical protein